jgi:hypothetical protein
MVSWQKTSLHFELVYLFDAEPSEKDLEEQELAMTELLAEFSDIATAKCIACVSGSRMFNEHVLVYDRCQ